MNSSLASLYQVRATKVLGHYNHSFTIDQKAGLSILYGPNGVGKTKLLEIVKAVTDLDGDQLLQLPFEEISLFYVNGDVLSARRNVANNTAVAADVSQQKIGLELLYKSMPSVESVSWKYNNDDFLDWLAEEPFLGFTEDGSWTDLRSDEPLDNDDLFTRFSTFQRRGRLRRRPLTQQKPPLELANFVEHIPSFLIETQRLRVEQKYDPDIRRSLDRDRRVPPARPPLKIKSQADEIKQRLNEAQTAHSRETQKLDRTFLSRVLAQETSKNWNADAIRERYEVQNQLRNRIGKIASVELDGEVPLPSELSDWALRLLSLYLEDTEKKLEPFKDLLEKIELLEQLVNRRLLNKILEVSERTGLEVRSAPSEVRIPLEQLSSGEQHQIILMYDLLFNVQKGSLVLIDEPEISLHVAWQKAFIPDVKRIAHMVGFQFVVATHSPLIINTDWTYAHSLGTEPVGTGG